MRYVGQEHAVAVGMPADVSDEAARIEVKRRFDEAHDLRYSHSAPEDRRYRQSARLSDRPLDQAGIPANPER